LTAAGQGTGWVGLDDDDNDAGRLATVLSLALSPRAHGERSARLHAPQCCEALPDLRWIHGPIAHPTASRTRNKFRSRE
jgi:ATP/maltotriose-dependent transcriptional regulator MalT